MKSTPDQKSMDSLRVLLKQNRTSVNYLNLLPSIRNEPELVYALIELAVSDEPYPYPQYASHLLLHVARADIRFLESSFEKMVECILITKNESVLRNLLGVILCFPIGGANEGELLDHLFKLLADPASKPGIINYSVRKIIQYINLYPELEQELETVVAFREELKINPGLSAWVKSVCKKELKSVRKSTR